MFGSTQLRPRHWRWGWVDNTTLRPLYPQERPGTHCTEGWVGLDGCRKSRPPPGFDRRTVQAVASRYTDWAIPAHGSLHVQGKITNTLKIKLNCKNNNDGLSNLKSRNYILIYSSLLSLCLYSQRTDPNVSNAKDVEETGYNISEFSVFVSRPSQNCVRLHLIVINITLCVSFIHLSVLFSSEYY